MHKVESALFSYKRNIFDNLPQGTNSLEIEGESLFDYDSLKRPVSKDVHCANIPSNLKCFDCNSENSDSLVSSPESSSSDPDSLPSGELSQMKDINFWNKFGSDTERKETSGEEFDDILGNLIIGNSQQGNGVGIRLSADKKDSEFENGDFFSGNSLTCGSSPVDKDDCMLDMFPTFENCNLDKGFKNLLTVSSVIDEQCDIPDVVKNSEEGRTFSDLLGDICLEDKNAEGIFSSCSTSLSDIDSFLNSVNLNETSIFNPETKLKNVESTGDMVICDENISLADLAKQHFQSNFSSSPLHTTLQSNHNFSTYVEESESFNTSWFSPIQSKYLSSSAINENDKDNSMFNLLVDHNQESSNKENNLELEEATLQVIGNCDENGDQFGSLDIDLTSCLKSLRPLTPLSDSTVVTSDNQSFHSDTVHSVSPFMFSCPLTQKFNDFSSKVGNANANQSLFAKALSCKPKKDLSAMLKVLKLQSEVCGLIFSPSQVPHNTRLKNKNAIESNQSVIGSIGRRIFGQIPQCEVS